MGHTSEGVNEGGAADACRICGYYIMGAEDKNEQS